MSHTALGDFPNCPQVWGLTESRPECRELGRSVAGAAHLRSGKVASLCHLLGGLQGSLGQRSQVSALGPHGDPISWG